MRIFAFRGLDLQLVGYLLGQSHDIELVVLQAVHVALELRDRIQIVHYVYQAVDTLLGALQILAVDEFILEAAVQQRRDITLNIEYRGLQLVRHVTQILFAELLRLLQSGDLLVVVVGPCRELLRDLLHVFILEFVGYLGGMHVAREDDRIDGFELVGHIRPYRIERKEGQQREHHNRHTYDHPPYNAAPRHHRRHDDRSHQCQQQRCALLSFYSHHNLQLLCFQTFFPFHPAHPAAGKRFLLFLRFSLLRSVFTSPLPLTLFLVLLSHYPLLLPPLFLAHTHCPLRAYTAGAIYVLRPAEERPTTVNLNTDAAAPQHGRHTPHRRPLFGHCRIPRLPP